MSLKEIKEALKELSLWLDWEHETIEDFHLYSQRFKFSPGSNVLRNVLNDALGMRGMTLEQLRSKD